MITDEQDRAVEVSVENLFFILDNNNGRKHCAPLEKGVMFMRFAMKQIGSISKVFFWEKCPSEVFTFL